MDTFTEIENKKAEFVKQFAALPNLLLVGENKINLLSFEVRGLKKEEDFAIAVRTVMGLELVPVSDPDYLAVGYKI